MVGRLVGIQIKQMCVGLIGIPTLEKSDQTGKVQMMVKRMLTNIYQVLN